jgi:hypothetical protein
MENRPDEREIAWDEKYTVFLGLNKDVFYEVYYDDFQDKVLEIMNILKGLNGEV